MFCRLVYVRYYDLLPSGECGGTPSRPILIAGAPGSSPSGLLRLPFGQNNFLAGGGRSFFEGALFEGALFERPPPAGGASIPNVMSLSTTP